MRLVEMFSDTQLPGVYVHETSPEAAEHILKHGFKDVHAGVFFNKNGTSYSGNMYGKSKIFAKLNVSKALDLSIESPPDLDEFADGDQIASYARKNGYQAWFDDLQIAVLDTRCIEIVPSQSR